MPGEESLCAVCKLIFRDGSYDDFKASAIASKDACRYHTTWLKQQLGCNKCDYWLSHHTSKDALETAAAAGCQFCSIILIHYGQTYRGKSFVVPLRYQLSKADSDSNVADRDYHISLSGPNIEPDGLPPLAVAVRPAPTDTGHPHSAHLNENERHLWDLALQSQSTESTGSPQTFVYAKGSLKQCLKSHSQCGIFRKCDWVPTRLLDLKSISTDSVTDSEVRLVETSDNHIEGPYATLSHCWGKEEFWVTTKENIEDLYNGCPISNFPPTFQQAMSTVRALGINYIWIDCYCIIQRDEKDWEHEASEMHMVYMNSIINIGASDSSRPWDGLFRDRSPLHAGFIQWCPTAKQDIGRTWVLYPQLLWAHESEALDLYQDPLYCSRYLKETSPLLRRAWVIQECVLSPRMLLFSQKLVHWQCSEAYSCELFPLGDWENTMQAKIHGPNVDEFPFWTTKHVPPLMDAPQPGVWSDPNSSSIFNRWFEDIDKTSLYTRWFSALKHYIHAELTYRGKDLFKALDGIGKHIAALASDDYYRGILAETMPNALCWYVDWRIWHMGEPAYKRDPEMPSWHWGSYTDQYVMPHFAQYPKYRKVAHVFMSTECTLFPSKEDYATWPLLYVLGRLTPFSEVVRAAIDDEDDISYESHGLRYNGWPNPDLNSDDEFAFLPLFEYETAYSSDVDSADDEEDARAQVLGSARAGLIVCRSPGGWRWQRAGVCTETSEGHVVLSKAQLIVLE